MSKEKIFAIQWEQKLDNSWDTRLGSDGYIPLDKRKSTKTHVQEITIYANKHGWKGFSIGTFNKPEKILQFTLMKTVKR
jgi:hypothetical protein